MEFKQTDGFPKKLLETREVGTELKLCSSSSHFNVTVVVFSTYLSPLRHPNPWRWRQEFSPLLLLRQSCNHLANHCELKLKWRPRRKGRSSTLCGRGTSLGYISAGRIARSRCGFYVTWVLCVNWGLLVLVLSWGFAS